MRDDTQQALVLNARGARVEQHDPIHSPPPPTQYVCSSHNTVQLIARAGAAIAAKMIQFVRYRFENWMLGVVRDAETVLDAMTDRYVSINFRIFSLLIILSRAIEQLAVALRQARGANRRRDVYASRCIVLLLTRATLLSSLSLAARYLRLMVCTFLLFYLIADCLISHRALKVEGRVE
jgi:hypothetical protein